MTMRPRLIAAGVPVPSRVALPFSLVPADVAFALSLQFPFAFAAEGM